MRVSTPPDPRTGEREIEFDPLEWIDLVTRQIPDPKLHLTRYYGAYACRTRGSRLKSSPVPPSPAPSHGSPIAPAEPADSSFTKAKKASWARLLRKIFEVDPLLCGRCGARMQVIAVITDPKVIDRILRHRASGRGHDPFESRAPPVG